MFPRIRIALGLALAVSLFTSITALAKGKFSFIAVTGGQLTEEIRLSDLALTGDFFTFADSYKDKAETPGNPGTGYEITCYYVNGYTTSAFDRLHYYPETGYVYYDGIVNGSSEYDSQWYTAQPDLQDTFEIALTTQLRLQALGTEQGARSMVLPSLVLQPKNQDSTRVAGPQTTIPMIVMMGMAIVLVAALLRFRRSSAR